MSHRLAPARGGEAPTLSIRTTPEIIAGVDQALTALRAALPAGVRPESVTRGDAARLLLVEAIAARAARHAAPPVAEAHTTSRSRAKRAPVTASEVAAEVHDEASQVRARWKALAAQAPRDWTVDRVAQLSGASRAAVGRLSGGKGCSSATVAAVAKILPA